MAEYGFQDLPEDLPPNQQPLGPEHQLGYGEVPPGMGPESASSSQYLGHQQHLHEQQQQQQQQQQSHPHHHQHHHNPHTQHDLLTDDAAEPTLLNLTTHRLPSHVPASWAAYAPEYSQAVSAMAQANQMSMPAMDFNGYILYASGKPVPEELMRVPTAASVAEPGSVLDDESGRTYHNHNTGKYFFPNDPAEQDRLDLQHKLITVLMDGDLHRCPVSRPRNVLDIATGTGIWAIQFAKLHPESTVVGTDLSLIQPTDNVPPNVSFVKEDSERDEWVFPEPFDFVYLRFVLSCFDDHRVVMRKAFESLNPGGWIELLDPTFELLCTDGTTEGTGIKRWSDLILQSGPVVGRDFLVAKNYKQWLLDLGFVDVVEEVLPVPMNNWPSDPKFKDVGRWEMMNAEKGVRGIAWKLFRSLGIEPQEIEDIVRRAKGDFRDIGIHGFFPIYIVYGRKPNVGEQVHTGPAQ